MLIWHKNFFFAKFEYGYQNNAEFYADFKTGEKNVKHLLKKKVTAKSVWHITFSGWIFLYYFHRFEISVKFCEFWILICQKRTKKFWGHWVHIWVYVRTSRMQICKKWLNQLKNFFNKHFFEYYLASFCWWISSSCENHCTLSTGAPAFEFFHIL